MAAGPRDRRTTVKERVNPSFPVQPLNFNVQFAFDAQHEFPSVDLYWDDPALLPNNNDFEILGVNIYRSFDSEFGPFDRLNINPIGATYYRDETTQQAVVGEDVSGSFLSRGDEADNWTFKTANFPIIKPGFPRTFADSPDDVIVTIDGQQVRPAKVYGETGEVVLQTAHTIDPRTNERFEPVLPFPDSTITVDYTYNSNRLQFDLFKRAFWRVTTVGIDSWDGDTKETPLQWTQSRHIHQMENLDYIWREAIRRNRWMIDQGGERVKVFIHKYQGVPCGCRNQYNDPHPRNDCPSCFGTGILGGYEGPYEILLAPPDTERQIRQTDRGRYEEMRYDVWTGPRPLLSQRDFFVKLNGDRYSVGPVRLPTNRGNVLQQHFTVNLLDKHDIRYQVPVTGTDTLAFPETRPWLWDDADDAVRYPMITDKTGDDCTDEPPDGIEERGRTPVYENINYGP